MEFQALPPGTEDLVARTRLDAVAKRKISTLCWKLNSGCSTHSQSQYWMNYPSSHDHPQWSKIFQLHMLFVTFSILVPYDGTVIVRTTDRAGADACWISQAPSVLVATIHHAGVAFQVWNGKCMNACVKARYVFICVCRPMYCGCVPWVINQCIYSDTEQPQ